MGAELSRNFFDFAMGYTHPPLTDHEKRILDFGRNWYKNAGARENAIRENFGMSSTSYFQKLNGLRSHPEAREYAPDVLSRADRLIELEMEKRGR